MALSENGLNMGKGVFVSPDTVAKQAVSFLEHDGGTNLAVFDREQGTLIPHEQHHTTGDVNVKPIIDFLEKTDGQNGEIEDASTLIEAEAKANPQKPANRKPLSLLKAASLALIGGI